MAGTVDLASPRRIPLRPLLVIRAYRKDGKFW